jgi:hypothetical protein
MFIIPRSASSKPEDEDANALAIELHADLLSIDDREESLLRAAKIFNRETFRLIRNGFGP